MKARIAASVLLAAGLIAGCSPDSGVAAKVNGETITVDEVDDGMALARFYQEPPGPSTILLNLVQARALIDAARPEGLGVSASQAADFLDSIDAGEIKVDGEYTDAVLDLVRMNLITQSMNPGSAEGQNVIESINDFMTSADIELSPRYGTWDIANGGLQNTSPEWIE